MDDEDWRESSEETRNSQASNKRAIGGMRWTDYREESYLGPSSYGGVPEERHCWDLGENSKRPGKHKGERAKQLLPIYVYGQARDSTGDSIVGWLYLYSRIINKRTSGWFMYDY
jgi:hypothetical protein